MYSDLNAHYSYFLKTLGGTLSLKIFKSHFRRIVKNHEAHI